jgi:hypothetical protein
MSGIKILPVTGHLDAFKGVDGGEGVGVGELVIIPSSFSLFTDVQ